jgi:hypothetical protein
VSDAVIGGIKAFCCFEHLIEFTKSPPAKKIARKQVAAHKKEQKEKLKTAGDYIKEAQVAFNGYIRVRDKNKPCISCGCSPGDMVRGGTFDAGHYRSRGSAGHLRFHALNCWGQCKKCNRYLSGNVVEYRKRLLLKLGEKRLISLEDDNSIVRYTIPQLRRIKALYSRRMRLYERKFR